MKIVVCSDAHLDWVTHGVSRLDDVVRALDQSVDAAVAEKADAWLFLGDAFDPDSGPVVFRCLEEMIRIVTRLENAGIASVVLSGNHDTFEDSDGGTTLSPLKALGLDGLVVCDDPTFAELPTFDLVALPFTPAVRTYDPAWAVSQGHAAVRGFEQGRGAKRPLVVAGHMTTIPGVSPGEETADMPRGRDVRFPVEACRQFFPHATLLNGHIHRRQTSPDGVIIPGSMARLVFGHEDANTPCFLLVDLA